MLKGGLKVVGTLELWAPASLPEANVRGLHGTADATAPELSTRRVCMVR